MNSIMFKCKEIVSHFGKYAHWLSHREFDGNVDSTLMPMLKYETGTRRQLA